MPIEKETAFWQKIYKMQLDMGNEPTLSQQLSSESFHVINPYLSVKIKNPQCPGIIVWSDFWSSPNRQTDQK